MMAAGAASGEEGAMGSRAQAAFLPPNADLRSIVLPGLGETRTPRAAQMIGLKRQREEGGLLWELKKCGDETMSTSWDFERPRKEAPSFTASELDLSLKVGNGSI